MIWLAGTYFVAGSILGSWGLHFVLNEGSKQPTVSPVVTPQPIPSIAVGSPPSAVTPFNLGSLHYDPARAVLPDSKLTPGDIFPDATKDAVCTPGWSREHRSVTEAMRDQVYAEYGRIEGPGASEKDQLENELHSQVCDGKMPLAEAQRCIAANWVQCWVKYGPAIYGSPAFTLRPVLQWHSAGLSFGVAPRRTFQTFILTRDSTPTSFGKAPPIFGKN
jgi:hypothetical protein